MCQSWCYGDIYTTVKDIWQTILSVYGTCVQIVLFAGADFGCQFENYRDIYVKLGNVRQTLLPANHT